MLRGLEIKLSARDHKIKKSNILKEGKSPLENARIKAIEFYRRLRKPVFSCDSGLYIEGLQEDRQPGLNVRRVKGKDIHDQEMIEYY